MRTQEIYDKLVAAKADEHPKNFGTPFTITDLTDLRFRLSILAGIPGFSDDDEYFKSSLLFRTARDAISVPKEEWEALKERVFSYFVYLRGIKKCWLLNW